VASPAKAVQKSGAIFIPVAFAKAAAPLKKEEDSDEDNDCSRLGGIYA
jgi:hypothetical protein